MKFEMYSIGHLLFLLLPLVTCLLLWYFLKGNKSKQQYVGKIIGWVSLLIIISRNIYII